MGPIAYKQTNLQFIIKQCQQNRLKIFKQISVLAFVKILLITPVIMSVHSFKCMLYHF